MRERVVVDVVGGRLGLTIGQARQTMHISKADVEIASLMDIPVGEPTAEVRRVMCNPEGVIIYVADVIYRGDYIHLDMDLKP